MGPPGFLEGGALETVPEGFLQTLRAVQDRAAERRFRTGQQKPRWRAGAPGTCWADNAGQAGGTRAVSGVKRRRGFGVRGAAAELSAN